MEAEHVEVHRRLASSVLASADRLLTRDEAHLRCGGGGCEESGADDRDNQGTRKSHESKAGFWSMSSVPACDSRAAGAP